MPIITFPYAALEVQLARGAQRAAPGRADVLDALADYGCAVEGSGEGAEVSVEALMNRPDLFSLEGIARALRPFLGLGPAPVYAAALGSTALHVEPSVLEIRPDISAAVVRGVELDEPGLRRLLDTQEKLDLTFGRRRTRVSIGLHDLGPLTGPITYKGVDPRQVSFEPLAADPMPAGARARTGAEILEHHPKGREYAGILSGKPRVPLLVDARGTVLSMPPIINGTATQVKPGRRDLFLDVTGTSRGPVEAVAKLLAMLLAERGGTIETVEVHRPGQAPANEPDLSPSPHRVEVARASRRIGAPLRADEVAGSLERLGHRAWVVPGGHAVDVQSPAWRFDLLHEVDLIEDIAVGIGYRNTAGRLPQAPTIGEEASPASLARRARTALVGLGFLEVMTLTLTSPDDELAPGVAPDLSAAAVVGNPIARDHSVLRVQLAPSLFAVLRANTSRDLPQGVFEVGDVVLKGHNEARVALAYIGSDASFSRAKGIVQSLFDALGVSPALSAGDTPPFARGRCGAVACAGATAGHFGEVAPGVLEHFALTHPALAFEFSLEALARAPRG